MIWKDKNLRYLYAQCYLSPLNYPFNIEKKHTAFTLLVQLSNYQIQIPKTKKYKRAPAYTPPYSIKFTIDSLIFPEYGKIYDNYF